MKFKSVELIQIILLIIGIILSVLSVITEKLISLQFGLLFIGVSILLLFFDINLKSKLKIYNLILEIKNSELRQFGYEKLNCLEKTLLELKGGYLTIESPYKVLNIAFDFIKESTKDTEIYATQN